MAPSWRHAVPNHSDEIRTMTLMAYFRRFRRVPQRLSGLPPRFPEEARGLLSDEARRLDRYSLEELALARTTGGP